MTHQRRKPIAVVRQGVRDGGRGVVLVVDLDESGELYLTPLQADLLGEALSAASAAASEGWRTETVTIYRDPPCPVHDLGVFNDPEAICPPTCSEYPI